MSGSTSGLCNPPSDAGVSSNGKNGERYCGETVDVSILTESTTLPCSGLTVISRLVKAPMTEQISSWDQFDMEKRGIPTDSLFRVYEEWGKAGYGIIMTGNAMINPVDLQAPGNAIIYKPFESPERINAFSRLAETIKRHGSLAYVQLSHSGRQVPDFLNPNPVSASDVQLEPKMGTSFGRPTALTREGIDEIVEQLAYGAEFAHRTGFDGIEIHCAHGYLLSQFLSGTTNLRTDGYGGSLMNRARIIVRIINEIKCRVPETFSIGIKINSVEFQHGGFQPKECEEVCEHLDKLGLDFIELSGGTYEEYVFHHKRESTLKREAFFLDFADAIRPSVKTSKIIVSGGFRTSAGMTHAIEKGSTDYIGLGRPACEEPDLPKLLFSGRVTGARRPLLPETEDVLLTIVGGTQISQIASGEKPFNTACPEEIERFMAALKVYRRKQSEARIKGIAEAGFPQMTAAE